MGVLDHVDDAQCVALSLSPDGRTPNPTGSYGQYKRLLKEIRRRWRAEPTLTPVLWGVARFSFGTVNRAGFWPHLHTLLVLANPPSDWDMMMMQALAAEVWTEINPNPADGIHAEVCDHNRGGRRRKLWYHLRQEHHHLNQATRKQIWLHNWLLSGAAIAWTFGRRSEVGNSENDPDITLRRLRCVGIVLQPKPCEFTEGVIYHRERERIDSHHDRLRGDLDGMVRSRAIGVRWTRRPPTRPPLPGEYRRTFGMSSQRCK